MKKIKFNNTFSECLANYWTDYVGWGRATRSEYWWCYLVYNLIVSNILFLTPISALWWLASIVPSFCLMARRLHDTNRSNWNICWLLLPIVGWIILLVYLCQKGDITKNKYGMPRI